MKGIWNPKIDSWRASGDTDLEAECSFGCQVLNAQPRTPDAAGALGVRDVVHKAGREAPVAVADGDGVTRTAAVVDTGEPPQTQRQRAATDVAHSGGADARTKFSFALLVAEAKIGGQRQAETGRRGRCRGRIRFHHQRYVPVEAAEGEVRRFHFQRLGRQRRRHGRPRPRIDRTGKEVIEFAVVASL